MAICRCQAQASGDSTSTTSTSTTSTSEGRKDVWDEILRDVGGVMGVITVLSAPYWLPTVLTLTWLPILTAVNISLEVTTILVFNLLELILLCTKCIWHTPSGYPNPPTHGQVATTGHARILTAPQYLESIQTRPIDSITKNIILDKIRAAQIEAIKNKQSWGFDVAFSTPITAQTYGNEYKVSEVKAFVESVTVGYKVVCVDHPGGIDKRYSCWFST